MQKFNQKLTNKGWECMSALLDREMPVKERRKKRALVFWWISGAGAILLAGLAVWWYRQQRQVSAPKIAITAPGNPGVNPGASVNALAITANNIWQTTAKSQKGQRVVRMNRLESGMTVKEAGFGQQIAVAPLTSPVVASELPGPGVKEVHTPEFLQLLPSIAPQALREERSLEWPASLEFTPIKPLKLGFHKVRFGLYGTASTERLIAFNGISGGITMLWRPLTHWGLKSSIGYSVERPTVKSRPVADITAKTYNEYVNASGLASRGITANPNDKVLIPVSLFHQLEMPLLLFYQPVEQIRLYTGVKFARTMYANSDKSYVSGPPPEEPQVLAGNGSLNELATREMSFWKGYSMLGFGITPKKNVEFSLVAQFRWKRHHGNADSPNFADRLKAQSLSNPYNLHFQLSTTLFF